MKYILFVLLAAIGIEGFAQISFADTLKLSDDLQIIKLDDENFIHKTYINSEEFGRFASNGVIYISGDEAIIGDTPPSNALAEQLLSWINEQGITVTALIINHFHADCLGGLEVFHQQGIPSYSYKETARLAKREGKPVPQHTFSDSLDINVGSKKVTAYYFGKGHSHDNSTLWIPEKHTMFGGCMVKSLGARKGNLADADVEQWPQTVTAIKHYFPTAQIVIPGHGAPGGTELLDFTIQLFSSLDE